MRSADVIRSLVVVNGPIASGKSSVARSLAGIAENKGRRSAVIDLDEVWHMVDHQDPRTGGVQRWLLARRAAAAITDVFFDAGVDLVVIEGPFFTDEERHGYLRWLRSSVAPRFVTLDVSFNESLVRVRRDPHPGRVRSRDEAWLAERHAMSKELLEPLRATDVVVDTEEKSVDQVASEIAAGRHGDRPPPRSPLL